MSCVARTSLAAPTRIGLVPTPTLHGCRELGDVFGCAGARVGHTWNQPAHGPSFHLSIPISMVYSVFLRLSQNDTGPLCRVGRESHSRGFSNCSRGTPSLAATSNTVWKLGYGMIKRRFCGEKSGASDFTSGWITWAPPRQTAARVPLNGAKNARTSASQQCGRVFCLRTLSFSG
jgi:hypothetical protein